MSSHHGPQSPLLAGSVQWGQLSPWQIFNRIWVSAKGYPADSLDISPNSSTPLLSITSTLAFLATYYTVIFTGRELMRSRPAFELKDAFLVHNLYLTAISGILLVLFVEQLAPTIWKHGLFFTICDQGGWTGPLVTLYYVGHRRDKRFGIGGLTWRSLTTLPSTLSFLTPSFLS